MTINNIVIHNNEMLYKNKMMVQSIIDRKYYIQGVCSNITVVILVVILLCRKLIIYITTESIYNDKYQS